MNILLCNDDGIDSEGLLLLAEKLSKLHNVLIVAPSSNRSGTSHSLTIDKNIKIEKKNLFNGILAYAISGTPADCVKVASHLFNDFKIDLVVSGINKGHNIGTDIFYSGTVAICFESAFFGYKAIAFSSFDRDVDYDLLSDYAVDLIEKLCKISPNKCIFNVNFPRKEFINDFKYVFTPLGRQIYSDKYISLNNGEYKLVGEPLVHEENESDCDIEWSNKGYTTITPLLYDKTDYETLNKIKAGIKDERE